MRTHQKITLAIVGGSLVLHVVAWALVGTIRGERKQELVAISLAESKKKEKEKPKPPPPKPVEVHPAAAKVRAAAPKAEQLPKRVAPPSEAPKATSFDSLPDLGAMGNGGGPGLAVAGGGGGGGGGGAAPAPTATATHRHVELVPTDTCTEDLVKPKLAAIIQPAYTREGRQANVEGDVRLEVTVDATGRVVGVKVLRGLGYGLDESAIDTIEKRWSFKPATRCGRPVPATIRAHVTFNLS